MSDYKGGKAMGFFTKRSRKLIKARFRLPNFISKFLYKEKLLRKYSWLFIISKLYYENLLRYRCKSVGENLMIFGDFMLEGFGDVYIGDNVTMYKNVSFMISGHICDNPTVRIGNNCNIGLGVGFRCAEKIVIGDNCLIASGTIIMDNDGHPLHPDRAKKRLKVLKKDVKPVIIEDNVWIGDRCIIMKGVTIGEGSIVAGGSVVTKSIPPMKIAMGNPAKVVMWVPQGPYPSEDES